MFYQKLKLVRDMAKNRGEQVGTITMFKAFGLDETGMGAHIDYDLARKNADEKLFNALSNLNIDEFIKLKAIISIGCTENTNTNLSLEVDQIRETFESLDVEIQNVMLTNNIVGKIENGCKILNIVI